MNLESVIVAVGIRLEGDARTLLSEVEDSEPAYDRADEWLIERLAAGPALVTELEADAQAAGLAWRTIKRAKKDVGISAKKDGWQGEWRWRRP